MGSILQSYNISEPIKKRRSFVHYKGKPSASGFNLQPDRILTLNYINPNNFLPGSDCDLTIASLILYSYSFVELGLVSQIPISVSINKASRSPLSWTVNYLYPSGDVSDYKENAFLSNVENMSQDALGIISWSFSIDVPYEFYGQSGTNGPQVFGYALGDPSCKISAELDYMIDDYDLADNIPTEGLDLDINQDTLISDLTISEDSGLITSYKYEWSFGVL